MNYWLLKSEPNTFGIDHLLAAPKQKTLWDGVRNYQARNMMRDQMRINDLAFFYHSNTTPIGITGIVKIVSNPYPDPTQFDPDSQYFDPKTKLENPRWVVVDVQLVERFTQIISREQLKQNPELDQMQVLKKGNRLSITPVSELEWNSILAMQQ